MTGQQMSLDDLTLGRRLRDEGAARASANADDKWKQRVDEAIGRLAASGVPFSSNDLRKMDLGEPHHPNAWGARILAASNRKLIEKVASVPSDKPSTHGHNLGLWRGKASEAAA